MSQLDSPIISQESDSPSLKSPSKAKKSSQKSPPSSTRKSTSKSSPTSSNSNKSSLPTTNKTSSPSSSSSESSSSKASSLSSSKTSVPSSSGKSTSSKSTSSGKSSSKTSPSGKSSTSPSSSKTTSTKRKRSEDQDDSEDQNDEGTTNIVKPAATITLTLSAADKAKITSKDLTEMKKVHLDVLKYIADNIIDYKNSLKQSKEKSIPKYAKGTDKASIAQYILTHYSTFKDDITVIAKDDVTRPKKVVKKQDDTSVAQTKYQKLLKTKYLKSEEVEENVSVAIFAKPDILVGYGRLVMDENFQLESDIDCVNVEVLTILDEDHNYTLNDTFSIEKKLLILKYYIEEESFKSPEEFLASHTGKPSSSSREKVTQPSSSTQSSSTTMISKSNPLTKENMLKLQQTVKSLQNQLAKAEEEKRIAIKKLERMKKPTPKSNDENKYKADLTKAAIRYAKEEARIKKTKPKDLSDKMFCFEWDGEKYTPMVPSNVYSELKSEKAPAVIPFLTLLEKCVGEGIVIPSDNHYKIPHDTTKEHRTTLDQTKYEKIKRAIDKYLKIPSKYTSQISRYLNIKYGECEDGDNDGQIQKSTSDNRHNSKSSNQEENDEEQQHDDDDDDGGGESFSPMLSQTSEAEDDDNNGEGDEEE